MGLIISLTSFRRGTGKTNLAASLGCVLAKQGKRVGIVDANFQSPGLISLIESYHPEISSTLDDFLLQKCDITRVVYDIQAITGAEGCNGSFLVPIKMDLEVIHILQNDPKCQLKLEEALILLEENYHPDVILMDISSGLTENTLSQLALSDGLLMVLKPDFQGYEGTAVMVDLIRKLGVERYGVVLNDVLPEMNTETMIEEIENAIRCPVAVILPHCDELAVLGSRRILALDYPTHPMTRALESLISSWVG
ncbi:MAG TPA: MinD/ParA family protein [Anaerolineaceae bacterium]|nr:MinD/ParA family protein [Anaerolineaceae bacterium]HPN53794.1 MinD/ParA family protein [Anaerolineaceae bacterium]